MKNLLKWLGKNRLVATLLATATYLFIVAFHEEVTALAIKMRNAIGRDSYNTYLGYIFLALLLFVMIYFARLIIKSERKWLNLALAAGITGLMVLSFRYLMTYNIEAIHFVEYALVALILMPEVPWKEAYAGRWFYILRPWEGIGMIYLLFAGFFGLDIISR